MSRLASRRLVVTASLVVGALACTEPAPERTVTLGPADGRDLAPADTGRVRVGDPAPDFSLASYAGEVVSLSGFQGTKDVILVFYRGWW